MKDSESFIRWQGRAIEQFGYASNLILTLSVAALGYNISQLEELDASCSVWSSAIYVSLFLLCISIVAGLLCTINRLVDFRVTKEIAKENAKKKKVDVQKISLKHCEMRTKSEEREHGLCFICRYPLLGLEL